MKYDAAPAEAEVVKLLYFDKKTNLKPTVVCVSHLRGNANSMHYIFWPKDIGKYFFWNREDCIKRCEELADAAETTGLDARLGYKRIRPWRKYKEII